MIAQHELRHSLEHRHLDRLTFAAAVAMEDGGEYGVSRIDADDAIDHGQRHVARLLFGRQRDKRRKCAEALNKIVVGGLAGIGAIVAVSHQTDIDELRIDLVYVPGCQIEAAHGRRPDVVQENVGAFAQAKQGFACRRLLQIENDAAFIAVQLQIEWPHVGALGRPEASAHEIAFRRLDFDNVGAVVR